MTFSHLASLRDSYDDITRVSVGYRLRRIELVSLPAPRREGEVRLPAEIRHQSGDRRRVLLRQGPMSFCRRFVLPSSSCLVSFLSSLVFLGASSPTAPLAFLLLGFRGIGR